MKAQLGSGAERRADRAGPSGPSAAGLRLLLLLEAATFAAAAALHSGLAGVPRHLEAAAAESVIAAVLLLGVALTRLPEPWPRRAAVGAQAAALVGVVIGLVAIATGAGPRTAPDVAYHLAILVLLGWGIAWSRRPRRRPNGAEAG